MISMSLIGLLLSLFLTGKTGFTQTFPSNASVISGVHFGSVVTYSKAKNRVYHLEEDLFTSGNILYADGITLMTTDGKTSHLIVGTGRGYYEGWSDQAKFASITGFLQIKPSEVLVVDGGNHCLRNVSRLTNITSPFAGKCTITGLTDGQYTNSRFFHPHSILKYLSPETAIVIDYMNRALRLVELNTGQVKTLKGSLPGNPISAALDPTRENLIISFSRYVSQLNIKTLKLTALTSTTNTGGLDGDFSKASLIDAKEILILTSSLYLVADPTSRKVRIIDVNRETMQSICNGGRVSADGLPNNCSFNETWSLMLKSGNLYIGEAGAIRTISVQSLFYCKDKAISVRMLEKEQEKCIEVIPGSTICLSEGIHKYRVVRENCTISINITKENEMLPCRYITVSLLIGEQEKCIEVTPGHHVCFPLGVHNYRTPEQNCMTVVKITQEKDLLQCPDITAKLSAGEKEKCIEITPGHTICFPSGVYNYRIAERNCSVKIIITKDARNEKCNKKIYRTGDSTTLKAEVTLPDGSEMTLPVGKHIYKKHLPDNTTCATVVHVSDPKLKMRLDVSANYQFACNLLSDFKEITRTIAKTRYSQIKQLSFGICNESADYDVIISCASDVLQVIWPTDCLFESNPADGIATPRTIILENLQKTKSFPYLELLIPTHLPPVIQPRHNMEGLPATVVLTPVCSGNLKYMNSTETCQ